jgi:HAD superfamily hydrolase (TIGR01509 family)
LLIRLRRKYRITYLSNSNEVHWSRFARILQHADVAFSSHICRLLKPDPAIFIMVADAMAVGRGEICFFDDSARNVEAARAIGMDAHLTRGIEGLEAALGALGLDGAP